MSNRNIRPGVSRLFRLALNRRATVETDANHEIEFHLEERERQLVAQGMSASDARLEARRRFGDVDGARSSFITSSARVEQRAALRDRVQDLLQDIRFAFRSLRRSPSFVAIAVACLTLGIGANVAIFAVVDGVLIKQLPYTNPDQLVRVWDDGVVPAGILETVRKESQSYSALEGAEFGRQLSLTSSGAPTRVLASQTTAGLFDLLGARAALGRTFASHENEPTAPLTVLLSHALWQTRFGGDSAVVGTSIRLDGVTRTVIGVMPAGFGYPASNIQLWWPARFLRSDASYWWQSYFTLVGRLKPGVSPEQARAEAAVVFPRASRGFPMRMPDGWGRNVMVSPLRASMVSSARSTMLLLYAAVGLVLIVACINVAGLYMGRTVIRAREIAVRTALGAGRARIARLLLLESVLVAGAGAILGVLLAWGGLQALVSLLPADTPRLQEIEISARVLGMALALSLGTAITFALFPVLRVTRRDVASTLRSDDRSGAERSTARVSWALAVTQLALAVTLVASAALVIKSLWVLNNSDLGFRTAGVFTAQIPLPSFPNDTAARAPRFYDAVLEQTAAIPGVTASAVTSALPFGDGIQNAAMEVEAHPTPQGGVPATPQLSAVSADYFHLLNIPLLSGRPLNDADRQNTLRVGVVDETAARVLWPEGNVIGKRIRYVWMTDWITIVGVVGSVRRDSLTGVPAPSIYVPSRQDFPRAMRVLVRSTSTPASLARSLQAAVARADASVPIGTTQRLSELVRGSAAQQEFAALLLLSFGTIALLLGAVGIYGVVSASVVRRTREIGVRMALGASRVRVLRTVLEQSLSIAAAGVVLGLAGAFASASLLRALLAGVQMVDFSVLAAVVVLLAVVAIVSALAPALRASRVDPLTAIRAE